MAKLELDLEGFYHKSSYDELTMLDARNLIEALTTDYEDDEEEHLIE